MTNVSIIIMLILKFIETNHFFVGEKKGETIIAAAGK